MRFSSQRAVRKRASVAEDSPCIRQWCISGAGRLLADPMTTEAKTVTPDLRFTPLQWLICVIASIGFLFDVYEILMLPLIVRPALLELTDRKSTRLNSSHGYIS